jgi:hypothetical protein
MLNSRLLGVERCFVLPRGIYPERSLYRHAVFTPSEYPDAFPTPAYTLVLDPALKWSTERDDSAARAKWLRRTVEGFVNLQYSIESATHFLALDGFDDM